MSKETHNTVNHTNQPTHTKNPYPGLRPYREDEHARFFGRDKDCKILIDKLLADRLTLLFAASGVGKSSLLQAAVIPQLKAPLGKNLPVVYYNDWVSPPLQGLQQAIQEQLADKLPPGTEQQPQDLHEFLRLSSLFIRHPLLLILDQFEEFFRYQQHSAAFKPFIAQLTQIILDKPLAVNVCISMREDFALELNAFKPALPTLLFDNFYRLEKLKPEAAKDAILIPVEQIGFKYEDKLFKHLLEELLSRDLDRSQGNLVADTIKTVEPPYLQIICEQLWERDKNDPEKTIRFATYEKAGYAKGLLDNFIGKQVLSQFSREEKNLASKAFDHLISRRGTKMAHPIKDLAGTLNADIETLQAVLEKLAEKRVLRSQQREEEMWYELYHDLFSHSIDDWNTAWKNKMRARRAVIGMFIGAAVGTILFLAYDFWLNKHYTHLRMTLSDPYSKVELWQGKKGSWDIWGQQRFLSQIDMQLKDREPDKRLPQWPVHDNEHLTAELIGSLALKDRVAAFSRDGRHARALKIARDAISATGSEESRSADVINNLATIQTYPATKLLWDKFPEVKERSKLNEAMQFALSPQKIAYWLSDEQKVIDALTDKDSDRATDKAQKQLLVQRLAKLVPSDKVLFALIALLKDDHEDVRKSVVQALRALGDAQTVNPLIALLKDDSWEIRQSVAQALGTLSDAQAVNPLIALLKDGRWEVRQSVVQALGVLGNPQAVTPLIALLKDDNESVRQSVAQALGALGDAQAVNPLIALLKDDNEYVRQSVAEALGALGDAQATNPLIALLKDDHWEVRKSVAQALGVLGDTQATNPLIALLKDDNEYVRQSVAEALEALGDVQAINPLIAQLKDDDYLVRQSVTLALGALSHAQAVNSLIAQLKDDNYLVRKSVAQALGALGNVQAVNPLIVQLKDDHYKVRQSVAQVLGVFGDAQAVNPLIAQLKDDHWEVRQSVAQALGALGDAQAINPLIVQLKDDNKDVRQSVALALALLGDAQVVNSLIAQLKDDHWEVRQSVALALALEALGDAQAVNPLIAQLKDDHKYVRQSVAQALGALGDAQAVNPLIAQLKDDHWEVRQSVAQALGALGDAQAVNPLIAQLKDDHEYVRQSVAQALGVLGDAQAVNPLIAQLKDGSISLRQIVAQALGALGDAQAVNPLIAQLKNDSVRHSMALALGALGDAQAVNPLIAQLKDDSEYVRQSVVQALGALGDAQAVNPLIAQLKDDHEYVRQSVALALGTLRDAQAVNPLIALLKDDNKYVRQSVAQALGALANPQAVSALRQLFQTEEKSKTLKAITALALLSADQTQTVPYLRNVIDNDLYYEKYQLKFTVYGYKNNGKSLENLILKTLERGGESWVKNYY